MEAAAIDARLAGDGVVIEVGGDFLEVFALFVDLNDAEVAAKAG